jgi:hemolysin activation/secretion protein
MRNTKWILILLAIHCGRAGSLTLPNAGELMPPAPLELPAAHRSSLDIRSEPTQVAAPDAQADALKIVVKRLTLEGAKAVASDRAMKGCGFVAGQAYALSELRGMAVCIERYYQDQGYPVARVHLPAQNVSDGLIQMVVAEGQYGQVLVRNRSQVSGDLLSDMLQEIKTGDVVRTEDLESALLLLSDLPGVQVKSALVPGATLGSSDLMVDVLPARRVSGSIDADNGGNYYTGAWRAGATLFFNEPTGQGDVASLRLLTSGEGLNYLRAAYQLQLGQARVGASFSSLEYALGQGLENLLANGTAKNIGFFGSYPLLRSRHENMFLGASFESKRFEDRMDSVSSVREKSVHVASASLTGDRRDDWGQGGFNAYALTVSSGSITHQNLSALTVDAATANSNGHFNKFAFNASRTQSLSPSWLLYAGLNGQWASKNLDASEKMRLGGMSAVRAFPESEAYGDEGYVLNLEARWLVSNRLATLPGQFQLVGFVDSGRIKINKNPWNADVNQRQLSGAGLGLNWAAWDKYQVRMTYAHKLGKEVAQAAPDAQDRFWVQAIKSF